VIGDSGHSFKETYSNMSENSQLRQPESNPEAKAEQPAPNTDEIDASTRRELILRYGKYAIAAAPLLLFASKAHAIHSHP
jgi:hypothetical protein